MDEEDFMPRFAFRSIIDAITVYRALLCYRKTLLDLNFQGDIINTLDSILQDWQEAMNDPHGVKREIQRVYLGDLPTPSDADISQALQEETQNGKGKVNGAEL